MSGSSQKVSYLHYKVLAHESQEEFDALLAEYYRVFAAKGTYDFLISDMAQSHWNIARMRRIEEYVRDRPEALKVVHRYSKDSARAFKNSYKMLRETRRMNGEVLRDTPERRSLREFALAGEIPPHIARPKPGAIPPSIETLFGNEDPFALRA